MADREADREDGQRQRDRADVPLDPSSPGDTTNEDGVEIGWKGGVAGTTPNTNQWGESLADKRETAGRTSGISSVEGS